jgi:rhamnulokinase
MGPGALAANVSNERTGDGRYRPLTNVVGLWLLERTLAESSSPPRGDFEWRSLIASAAALPAPEQPLDVTDPAFINPASMRSAIDAQLRRRKLPLPKGIVGYTRLICDSIGEGHASALRMFEGLVGRKFSRIVVVGGGSRNSLICQATADASGVPVHAFAIEGSGVGNIARQLIGLQAVASLAEFRKIFARHLSPLIYPPHPI